MVIKELFKENVTLDPSKLPKHVALSVDGCRNYSVTKNIPYTEINKKKFFNMKNVTRTCVKLGIPIFTFYVLPKAITNEDQLSEIIDGVVDFFNELTEWEYLAENKIKVSVLGKWYDLPGRVVDPIKKVLDETKDYDNFFLNICINYDGQEEIVDATKLIARQVKAGKLDPDNIGKQNIKDNIYTSYFLPPDLIIKTGKKKWIDGLLLWDSQRSKIYFAGKSWPEFDRLDFLNALEFYQKN